MHLFRYHISWRFFFCLTPVGLHQCYTPGMFFVIGSSAVTKIGSGSYLFGYQFCHLQYSVLLSPRHPQTIFVYSVLIFSLISLAIGSCTHADCKATFCKPVNNFLGHTRPQCFLGSSMSSNSRTFGPVTLFISV